MSVRTLTGTGFILLLFFISHIIHAQWKWQNPLPQGNNLYSVCLPDNLTGYAAGDAGTVIKTTDGGISWEILGHITSSAIRSIAFYNYRIGLIAGDNGLIGRTADGGDTWFFPLPLTTNMIRSVAMHDSLRFLAAGEDGTILSSNDGGFTWKAIQGMPQHDFFNAFFTGGQSAVVLGRDENDHASVWQSEDGGMTWKQVHTQINEGFTAASFPDGMIGFAGTWDRNIYRTLDGGLNWEKIASVGSSILSIHFADRMNGTLLLYPYTAMETEDGGFTWETLDYPEGYLLNSLCSNPSGVFFGAGNAGEILELNQNGQDWMIRAGGQTLNHIYLRINENGTSLILGDELVMHSSDFGNSWIYRKETALKYLTAASFANSSIGCALTYTGKILRTTDGGHTWTIGEKLKNDRATVYTDICLSDPTHGFMIGFMVSPGGAFAKIIKRTVDGINWNSCDIPGVNSFLHRVKFFSPSTGFLLGSNAILKTTDGGDTWYKVHQAVGYDFRDIHFPDDRHGYVVSGWWTSSTLAVFKTIDSGESWEMIYSEPNTNMRQFYRVIFADSLRGYLIETPGKILRTDDGGYTWTEEAFYSNNELRDIYIRGIDNAMVVGDNGTIASKGNLYPKPDFPAGEKPIQMMVYPNPFNSNSILRYVLADPGDVTVKIFDSSGRLIITLKDEWHEAGEYLIFLHPMDLANGIYTVTARQGKYMESMKMIVGN